MARIVTRSKPAAEGNYRVSPAEAIVFVLLVGVIAWGIKSFLDYRQSAPFCLGEFIASIKAGNTANQYSWIDENEKKKFFPTKKAYTSNDSTKTLAYGYVERIQDVRMGREEKDSKNPNKVKIQTTIKMRDTAQGKQLYELGQSQTQVDNFVLRKNSDGKWRVVLSESVNKKTGKLNLQNITPNTESNY